jgi:DNA-binding NarL/FixJ family response regulator
MTVRVFIADDSLMLRQRLADLISEFENLELVGQTGDARQALEAIQSLRPDVVIMDIRMPEGNGIQVLEAVKAHESAPQVIMLTAFPYPQYRKECLRAGAEYFFDKATEFDHFAQVLTSL